MNADVEVSLSDVRKRFDNVEVLHGISLDINRGEFYSLLGPSGCGKTTTLRMIAGFDFPTSGEIRIRDRVVNNVPAHRRETNLVFQQLGIFPHLNVFDNVAFGLRIKRMPAQEVRKRVLAIIDTVDLTGMHDRRPSQLSGGQLQRVAIARALVNEPAVLLLDEPLGALDVKLRTQLQFELKSLQRRVGTTFIYVTHDQSEALLMSDRIAVMSRGHVEQVGTPNDIYLHPKTVFAASFIGEANLLAGVVDTVDATRAGIEVPQLGDFVAGFEGDVGSGEQGVLVIRPEAIDLSPATAPAQAGQIAGRVAARFFLGHHMRYEVDTPSGLRLRVDRPSGSTVVEVGEQVALAWRPEDAVIVSNLADEQAVQSGLAS